MDEASRPPVNEVILSISFESQSCLSGPQILVTLRDLISEFSKLDEKPPYEMPVELPTDLQQFQAPPPPFRIVGPSSTFDRRYWITKPDDDSRLIQLQANYLALNWRRRSLDAPYPGFDVIWQEFLRVLERVNTGVQEHGGKELRATHAELTYVNLLRPSELWQNHKELPEVVRVEMDALAEAERVQLAFSRSLFDSEKRFVGRIHSDVQTAFVTDADDVAIDQVRHKDLIPVVNITTTVRSSAWQPASSDSEVSRFFDFAHEEAGKTFRTIVSDRALEAWGM